METIGQKLAKIRKSAGLNQKELSSLVGRSSSYISRVESGEREHTPALLVDWLKVCKSRIKWTEKEYFEHLKEFQEYQPSNVVKNSRILAQDFFTENYVYNSSKFQKAFSSAKELSVIGRGQARMIITHASQIRRILLNGGKINFVLCNPNSLAIDSIVKISIGQRLRNFELVKQEHWASIDRLISLCKSGVNGAMLNIKLINLLPPYTIYGFDLSDPEKALLFIWLNVFKEPSETRPGFILTAADKYWFDFFSGQFNNFWNWEEAVPINVMDENYQAAFEKQK